jgi:WD repeat-containing protein 45
MKKLLPKYFDSEWSFAQFRIPDGKALCAFSEDGSDLIAVTTDGTYYLAEIPKKGGDCI